jgi:hypothetical protein
MVDEQFEDADSYNLNYMKDKITFRDIILQHLKKISQFASVEFRGGYWEERTVHSGSVSDTIRTYIPDTREVYSNAVECLADMLYPYFDKEMLQEEEKCNKAIKQAFNDNSVLVEPDREDETEAEEKAYRKFKHISNKLSYRSEKRIINRRLFRALCSFLYRKKYLELGSIED